MIKQIQIERFKGLRCTPLLNLGRINLLTGANGRGKSTLCQVLLILAQTWEDGAMDALLPKGCWVDLGVYEDVHYAYDANGTISFRINTDAPLENQFYLVYNCSATKSTLIEMSDAQVNGNSISDKSGNSISDKSGNSVSDSYNGNINVKLSRLDDYPSLTSMRRVQYIAANRHAASYREPLNESATRLESDGSNVLSVLWNKQDQRIISEVEKLMDEILDGAEIRITSIANELMLTLNSAKDDKKFKPINVGYGHSFILSVVTALVIASDGEILIVENPEAHLHPAAQAKLMNIIIRYANEKHLQVFVETHSDHILNTSLLAVKYANNGMTVPDLQVLFFSGDKNVEGHFVATVQNLDISKDGHILNPPKQFFEQYAMDLHDLYTNRRAGR